MAVRNDWDSNPELMGDVFYQIYGKKATSVEEASGQFEVYHTYDNYAPMAEAPHAMVITAPPMIGLQWSTMIQNRDSLPLKARPSGLLSMNAFANEGAGNVEEFAGAVVAGELSEQNDMLLGYIDNYSCIVVLEDGFYKSPRDLVADSDGMLPKTWSLSCNFIVLHTHELGRGEKLW